MKPKLLLNFIFLMGFINLQAQIVFNDSEFDSTKKGPNTIYYNFYNGIQLIEIDYNNYEKARVDFEDSKNPISSIRPRYYGHNTIIVRNENGELLHQYNNRGNLFVSSDFVKVDKSLLTFTHLERIENNYQAKSNYPSYGNYNLFVTENNKAGIIDTLGNPIINTIYDGIQSYTFNKKNQSFELFGSDNPETMIFTFQNNNKWGFKNNKITIEPKYEELIPLKMNVLRLKKAGKYGILNYKEKIIVAPIYSDLKYKSDFYLYTNQIIKNDSSEEVFYGIMNSKFKITSKAIYKNLEEIIENYYPSGIYWACKTNGCGAIDTKGKEISKFKYGEVQQNPYGKYYRTSSFNDAKNFILDLNFNEIGSEYDAIYNWKNLLFEVKKDNKYGLINLNSEIVLPCEYESIWESSNNDELGSLFKNKKYGVINSKGEITISCIYDYLMFSNYNNKIIARLIVKDSTSSNREIIKIGVIDYNGNLIIPIIYDEIETFDYGYFKVRIVDKQGILNSDGKVIAPIKYDEIYNFSNGFCIAKLEFGYGYLDKTGKEITHFYHERPTNFKYNSKNELTATAYFNGKEITIDEYGIKRN